MGSSRVDLGLWKYLKKVEESLTKRLARIEVEAGASESADNAAVAAVESMLTSPYPRTIDSIDCDEDIEDDFAGGTGGGMDSADVMSWRSRLAEFRCRLQERGHEERAMCLAELADENSLKKPFTAADEADVIKSILECLAAFEKEGTASDALHAPPETAGEKPAAAEPGAQSPPAIGKSKRAPNGLSLEQTRAQFMALLTLLPESDHAAVTTTWSAEIIRNEMVNKLKLNGSSLPSIKTIQRMLVTEGFRRSKAAKPGSGDFNGTHWDDPEDPRQRQMTP